MKKKIFDSVKMKKDLISKHGFASVMRGCRTINVWRQWNVIWPTPILLLADCGVT